MNDQLPLIPGYTLLAVAGQGGMGTVYKAEQASPRRLVALKVLRGAAASAADLATFRQEAQVIAALEHPHIVPLYAFGELTAENGQAVPFLALRYLNGGAVADRLRQGPIDLNTAARWITSVADALDFAHQRGIVHRDIKPSNILLDDPQGSNAYLTDFGIAGTLAAVTSGAPTGSAAYMPPEQGRGEAVDGRGDLYSLAVTLFEMLTGQKPYTAETAFGVMVRHLNDPIPSARALNPAIPPAVDELIQWGMAKTPDERPQTAKQFTELLKRAVAHPTASLRPAIPAGTGSSALVGGKTLVAQPVAPRSNTLIWIVVIILLGILCLGSVVVVSSGALALFFIATPTPLPTATDLPTLPPTPTATPAPTGTPDPDGGVTRQGDATEITVRRNGIEFFSPQEIEPALDVSLEARIIQLSGPANNEIALVCRWQDVNNYTALALSGAGEYSIWQKRDGELNRLVDWTPSPTLNTGAGRTLQVVATCSGSELLLSVDGELVGQAVDPNPISGDVALMAGLREEGELVVRFEGLKIKNALEK